MLNGPVCLIIVNQNDLGPVKGQPDKEETMEAAFEVKTVHTKKIYEDFARFTHKISSPVPLIRIWIIIVGFALVGASLYKVKSYIGTGICLVITIFLLVLVFCRAKLAVVRMVNNNPDFDKFEPVVFHFYQNAFTLQSVNLDESIDYKRVTACYENKEYFFIRVDKDVFQAVPKVDFTQGDAEQFRDFILRKTKLTMLPVKYDASAANAAMRKNLKKMSFVRGKREEEEKKD